MKNGPELWAAILAPVQAAFGSGVVAGGAVRDYLLGAEPKDIDVFVNVRTAEELGAAIPVLSEAGIYADLLDHTEYEDAPDWVGAVTGVLDGGFEDWTVQIIGRPAPDFSGAQVVANFDFGITQCWFDGEVHDTPTAKADRDAKTVTLTRWNSPEHVQVSMDRFVRFNVRHLGVFTLIDGRDGSPLIRPALASDEEFDF